jgi:hypothetical protein
MKLVIENNVIVALVKDEHQSDSILLDCPEGFDYDRWDQYIVDSQGNVVLPEGIEKKILSDTLKQKLDQFAQTRNYDDIASAISYHSSGVEKYSQEGTFCRDLRDQCWQVMETIFNEMDQGTTPLDINWDSIRSRLPAIVWPVELV